ncbi:hypothetical protein [Halarsenatibacter silvermanii]|nr:hypothetical protein [Halarsenatibacter silvermanii]
MINLDLSSSFFWQLFERTGSLSAYLAYREIFDRGAENESKFLLNS